jgi:cell division protein YceG involved in septum cleavage
VLRRALHAMDAVWPMPGRARANTPLKSADEALILASIVEKETGRAETARRLPACSPTACAWACCCRPTR